MTDEQASAVIQAVLELAVTVRDEVGPAVAERARDVLKAAGGDPIAALTVAAALVRVDVPIDTWWSGYAPPPVVEVPRRTRRQVAVCGTRAGYMRHLHRGEPYCDECRAAESTYQRERHQRRKGAA